ncbi:Chromosome-associated kinesin kif4a [Kappamyces sp. JEL0829]|nr:Chromosome-associated kinesin kif4a [Kappamyces sp. JEL0829]
MGSSNDRATSLDDQGIIPRVFDDIFSNLSRESGVENILKVSFLEIYQEQIRDLLMPHSTNREISVRENKGTIVVLGVHEQIVRSAKDMIACLVAGGIERTTGNTLMHTHSSRSHAIFSITLEQATVAHPDATPVVIRRSKLHLVDLAGSERLKRTGAEGVRFKESVKINSGLLALGNVISILGDDRTGDSDRQTHVPYRDSKLTRLLQDSLGGNSQTLMLACVSPLYEDMDETINTMKYAYRARKIQNKPIVNVIDQMALERSSMQQKIDQLEGKLKGLEDQGTGPVPVTPEMIDFDNDQWMQYFIDQLKNRTAKGSNAVKALEAANEENERLKEKIRHLETAYPAQSELYEEKVQALVQSREQMEEELQTTIDQLLPFCVKVVLGETVGADEMETIVELLKLHRPMEMADHSASKEYLFPPAASTISQQGTRANSVARTNRRKRINTDENSTVHRESDEGLLKPLEMELRETRKYLGQMEDELNRTRIRLQQMEAVSEKSSLEIARLMEENGHLKAKGLAAPSGLPKSEDSSEIVSVKVLSDAAVQTSHEQESPGSLLPKSPVAAVDPNESFDFPVFTSQGPVDANVERLTEELGLATKAKVDLLKELSKVNKEAEKTRHAHADQMLKLERELEAAQREMHRLIDEHQEKDLARERIKEDLERRLKHQESAILKYKHKQKDLEKTLQDKGSGARRLQESQQEIEKLASQVTSLKKKIKDDHDRMVELEIRKSKEISVLNKQLEDEAKKGRQLEVKFEMIRKKLDRKSEEVAAMGKKFRDPSNPAAPAIARRQSLLDTSLDEDAPSGHDDERGQSRGEKGLAQELKLARTKMAQLEEELAKSHLQAGVIEKLQKEKSETVLQIAELRSEIRNSEARESDFGELAAEWSAISERFQTHDLFGDIVERMPSATLSECRKCVIECLQQAAEMETLMKTLESARNTAGAEVAEYKDQVYILDKRMQKIIRAYEKKVQGLQRELEQAKTATVETIQRPSTAHEHVQTDSVDAAVSPEAGVASVELEKDLFYYKHANKELKSKLREVVAVNHRLAKTLKEQQGGKPMEGVHQENISATSPAAESPSVPVAV